MINRNNNTYPIRCIDLKDCPIIHDAQTLKSDIVFGRASDYNKRPVGYHSLYFDDQSVSASHIVAYKSPNESELHLLNTSKHGFFIWREALGTGVLVKGFRIATIRTGDFIGLAVSKDFDSSRSYHNWSYANNNCRIMLQISTDYKDHLLATVVDKNTITNYDVVELEDMIYSHNEKMNCPWNKGLFVEQMLYSIDDSKYKTQLNNYDPIKFTEDELQSIKKFVGCKESVPIIKDWKADYSDNVTDDDNDVMIIDTSSELFDRNEEENEIKDQGGEYDDAKRQNSGEDEVGNEEENEIKDCGGKYDKDKQENLGEDEVDSEEEEEGEEENENDDEDEVECEDEDDNDNENEDEDEDEDEDYYYQEEDKDDYRNKVEESICFEIDMGNYSSSDEDTSVGALPPDEAVAKNTESVNNIFSDSDDYESNDEGYDRGSVDVNINFTSDGDIDTRAADFVEKDTKDANDNIDNLTNLFSRKRKFEEPKEVEIDDDYEQEIIIKKTKYDDVIRLNTSQEETIRALNKQLSDLKDGIKSEASSCKQLKGIAKGVLIGTVGTLTALYHIGSNLKS